MRGRKRKTQQTTNNRGNGLESKFWNGGNKVPKIVKLRWACPTCGAQMTAFDRKLVCSANNNHMWNDLAVFQSLNLVAKYEEDKPPIVAQTNHVKWEVTVPPRVKQALEAKFGGTSESTIAGVLAMLSEGDILIVPESDLQRMKERFGKRPESSGELFGLMYSMSMDLETEKLTADTARKDVQAYEGRNPNSVLIDLGPIYGTVVEKARDQNEPVKVWVERNLKNAVENSWF